MSFGVGPQGYQGVAGRQGDRGFQGDRGHQGRQGFQGSPGRGSQGYQGLTGTGNQGFQGVAGSQGAQGATGTGNQGFQGAAGSQGNQGFQGVTGSQGNQGFQGVAGSQGFQGAQGFQGVTGSGSQGSQGFQGAAGSQGNQGFQGVTGSQGNQGFQGATGTGSQGAQGAQGTSGGGGSGSSPYQFAYTYSSTTSPAGIATGTVRFNTATLANVAVIYLHLTDANSRAIATLQSFFTVGSTVSIRENSTDNYFVFMVQGLGNNGTYLTLTGDSTIASGSFTNGDSLTVELLSSGLHTADVAYISTGGSDTQGALGCPTHPFATMGAAMSLGARTLYLVGSGTFTGFNFGATIAVTIITSMGGGTTIDDCVVDAPNTLTIKHLGPPENLTITTVRSSTASSIGGTLIVHNATVTNVLAYGQTLSGANAGNAGGAITLSGCNLSGATLNVGGSASTGNTSGLVGGAAGTIILYDCRYYGSCFLQAVGGAGSSNSEQGGTGGAGGAGGRIEAINVIAIPNASPNLYFYVVGGNGADGGPPDEYGLGFGAGGTGGAGGNIYVEGVVPDLRSESVIALYAYGGSAGLNGNASSGTSGGAGGTIVATRCTLTEVINGVGDCGGGSGIGTGTTTLRWCHVSGACNFTADTLDSAAINAFYTHLASTVTSGGTITRAGYYVVENGTAVDAWV